LKNFFIELKKLTSYFIILFFLFLFNLIFNLNYNWDGISLIVRIYVFIISFSIVFSFSFYSLENSSEKTSLTHFQSFFLYRIVPFLLIYFITIVFTLINYTRFDNSFAESALQILDGRFSNTIVYSLILLVMFRVKIDTKKKIFLFLSIAILYFVIDKILYLQIHDNLNSLIIKILKYFLFFFVLFSEYFKNNLSFFKKIIISLVIPVVLTSLLLSFFVSVHRNSDQNSYFRFRSSKVLLKMGFEYPIKDYQRLLNFFKKKDFEDLLKYSKKYKYGVTYSNDQWLNILKRSEIDNFNLICGYLHQNKIYLDFDQFLVILKEKLIKVGRRYSDSNNIALYLSLFFDKERIKFFKIIDSKLPHLKLLILDVLLKVDSIETIPFLIEFLLDLNPIINFKAYNNLIFEHYIFNFF